ncbi:MAG: hypothetical protein AAFU68_06875 [Pseudomonadota bacterium]
MREPLICRAVALGLAALTVAASGSSAALASETFARLTPGDAYVFTSNRPGLEQIVRVYRGLVGDEHVWEVHRSLDSAQSGAAPWRTYWRDLDGRIVRSRDGGAVISWEPHDCAAVDGRCEFSFQGEDGRWRDFRRVSRFQGGAWFHELYEITSGQERYVQQGASERDEDGVFTYHQIQPSDQPEMVFQLQEKLRL